MNTQDKATASLKYYKTGRATFGIVPASSTLIGDAVALAFAKTEETAKEFVRAVNEYDALNAAAEAAQELITATFAGATPKDRATLNEAVEVALANLAALRKSTD